MGRCNDQNNDHFEIKNAFNMEMPNAIKMFSARQPVYVVCKPKRKNE
jgi:hypothetical protein